MTTRREIENTRPDGAQGIAMMAKKLGYKAPWEQLMFSNGASATNLIEFLDDNPGACEAIVQWVLDHGFTSKGEELSDEEDDDECNCGNKVNSPECEKDPHE